MRYEKHYYRELANVCKQQIKGCYVIKHNDRSTAGIPDMSIAWNGNTTWMELKLLDQIEDLHRELGKDQLVTCVKLEQATVGHCWIVAFIKKPAFTWIFRPSKLLGEHIPYPSGENKPGALWFEGVIILAGRNYRGIAELIKQTHTR